MFCLCWFGFFFPFCATTPSSVLYCIVSRLISAERLFLSLTIDLFAR